MQAIDFTDLSPGRLVRAAEGYPAFCPNPLPPVLEPSWGLMGEVSDADRAVSELAGVARNLPNPHLLIRPFVQREAVLSSRIEGTQASLAQLLLFDAAENAEGEPPANARIPPDVTEVANYVRALEHGLRRMARLPVSLRLIREIHGELMRGARGHDRLPGEFRRVQNWIGPDGGTPHTARYVPPPVGEMQSALDALERFFHSASELPPLVRMALVHYQFEAIHPFLDGNGRVGRLLITVLLCHERLLPQPLLYLSAYFERNRARYYELLLQVSQRGNWGEWLEFFLRGVTTESRDAVSRAGRLLDLREKYRQHFSAGRSSGLVMRVIDDLFAMPVLSIGRTAKQHRVTFRAANQAIARLVEREILQEVTGRSRYRLYACREVIRILEA